MQDVLFVKLFPDMELPETLRDEKAPVNCTYYFYSVSTQGLLYNVPRK